MNYGFLLVFIPRNITLKKSKNHLYKIYYYENVKSINHFVFGFV